MWPAIIASIIPAVEQVIGTAIGDKEKAAAIAAQIQLALIGKQAEVDKSIADAAKAQAEVNLQEAQSPSVFVAGWRPFIGWVCGFGCAYSFLMQPVLSWISGWFGGHALPSLEVGQLMPLVLGMLGLGTLRTVEKVQGVERQNMNTPSLVTAAKKMFK